MAARDLQQKIERYHAWHRLARSWTILQFALFFSLSFLALYIVSDKLLYFGFSCSIVSAFIACLCLLGLLVSWLLIPRDLPFVTYLIDRNAGLKNLVSSGLCVISESDEVSSLVIERAKHVLDAHTPRQLIPTKLHWSGRFLYIPLLVLMAAFMIPQLDLLGRKQKREQAEIEKAEVKKGALKLAAKMTSIQSSTNKFESVESQKITKDFNKLANELATDAKKDALLKLGEFENKYREEFAGQRNFEQAAKALKASPDMQGMAPVSQEELKKFVKNMTDGNFKDAAQAARELAKQLQSNDLSSDEKKALARELAKIAEKMKGSGMNEDLAKLLRQIEASPENLSELLKQCESAGKDLAELANMCEQCDGLKAMKDGLAEAKQEMMGNSFSDFDAKEVEQYMEGEAALGEMEGCGIGVEEGMGTGGTGGVGKGRGGAPLENMTDTAFKSEMSPSKLNKGKILHELFVTGVPEKGEALAEYSDVVKAAKQQAAGSLARDQIPREYENMVKTYFDSLDMKEKGGNENEPQ